MLCANPTGLDPPPPSLEMHDLSGGLPPSHRNAVLAGPSIEDPPPPFCASNAHVQTKPRCCCRNFWKVARQPGPVLPLS